MKTITLGFLATVLALSSSPAFAQKKKAAKAADATAPVAAAW